MYVTSVTIIRDRVFCVASWCVCCCCIVEQFIEFGLHLRELRLIRSTRSEFLHMISAHSSAYVVCAAGGLASRQVLHAIHAVRVMWNVIIHLHLTVSCPCIFCIILRLNLTQAALKTTIYSCTQSFKLASSSYTI